MPSPVRFQLISHHKMSPVQLCGPSPSHSHSSPHSCLCAVKTPQEKTSYRVRSHSFSQQEESGSRPRKVSGWRQTACYYVRRKRRDGRTSDQFPSGQYEKEENRICCPRVRQRTGQRRRSRSGRKVQGQGGLRGRWWSSYVEGQKEEVETQEEKR